MAVSLTIVNSILSTTFDLSLRVVTLPRRLYKVALKKKKCLQNYLGEVGEKKKAYHLR